MSTIPFITKRNRRYSLADILKEVCDIYGVSIEMVKSKCKKEEYVRARRMYIFASTSMTNYTLEEIAVPIGKREHTKILYHRDRCRGYFKKNIGWFMDDYRQYLENSKIWQEYIKE